MKKVFKARGLGNGAGNFVKSDIDWKAINDQVDAGTQSARISAVIGVGLHQEETALSDKGHTGFLTKADAKQYMEEMKAKYGEKHPLFADEMPEILDASKVAVNKYCKTYSLEDDGSWTVLKEDPDYVIGFNEFGGVDKNGNPKFHDNLVIMADLVDNIVDYGGDIGEKPYRIMLNRVWDKKIYGFPLKKVPPATEGGTWTVKGNSKLAELANATDNKHLLEVDLEDANWFELAGAGMNISIGKKGADNQYINIGKCVGLKKNRKTGAVEEIGDLLQEPTVIMFDDVTVEELEEAHLRYDVIKLIKSAQNYEGSMMQEALEEYEERQKAKAKAKAKAKDTETNDDEGNDDGDDEGETTARKVKKTQPAETKSKAKKEPEPKSSNDDNDDDDNDWDE